MEEVIYSKNLRNSVVKAQQFQIVKMEKSGIRILQITFKTYENLYSQHTLGEAFD